MSGRDDRLREMLGELATSDEWTEVAASLEGVAALLPRFRMGEGPNFNRALADLVSSHLSEAAAQIRANLALEELTECQNRS